MKTIINFVFFFISTIAFGQKTLDFPRFVEQFPEIELPVTIQYSRDEFDYAYYTPDESEMNSDSILHINDSVKIEYQNSVLRKSELLTISYELVKAFLLADTENVFLLGPESNPLDTIYPSYFISQRLKSKNDYLCLIYEAQFEFAGHPIAEKYLCTLTKTGKLIDKVLVASANYSGTGIIGNDYRIPWYPNVKSLISIDMTITFSDENSNEKVFKIDKFGKIIF